MQIWDMTKKMQIECGVKTWIPDLEKRKQTFLGKRKSKGGFGYCEKLNIININIENAKDYIIRLRVVMQVDINIYIIISEWCFFFHEEYEKS